MSDTVRATQCRRILNLLQSKEAVSLSEIMDLRIAKYSSRISEMRRQGYKIECEELPRVDGQRRTRYRLLEVPQ